MDFKVRPSVNGTNVALAGEGGSGTPTGTKVSALAAASGVASADEFVVSKQGVSQKATGAQIAAFIGTSVNSFSTADQTPPAGIGTILTGSVMRIPAGLIRVGTIFRWTLVLTKTAAGTGANLFRVNIGTTGTGTDPTILSFQTTAQTAVVDTGQIDVFCTVRQIGTSGFITGVFKLAHNLSTTGLATVPGNVIKGGGGSFNSTTSNLFVSMAVAPDTNTALTFSQVLGEALNL